MHSLPFADTRSNVVPVGFSPSFPTGTANLEQEALITTGDALFAECLGHSAKALLHSAKALPSAALGKEPVGKGFFAECHVLGTR